MNALPTWWIRKAAALAVLAGFALAIWMLLIAPVRDAYSYYWTEIAMTEKLLARYASIAARKEGLEAQGAALRESLGTGRFYYAGGDLDLIAAEMQQKVTRVISDAGGQVQTAQILTLPAGEPYQRVGLRVRFAAPIESLQRILYEIEEVRPYLFTDSLEVRTGKAMLRNALRQVKSEDVDGSLVVGMDISAFTEEIRP